MLFRSLEKPDVVVLDLVMGGMGGLEVMQKLREQNDHPKIIVATADIQISTQAMAEEIGSCGFLTKPIKKEELLNAVNFALDRLTV